jgi:hypothetical protein
MRAKTGGGGIKMVINEDSHNFILDEIIRRERLEYMVQAGCLLVMRMMKDSRATATSMH